MNPLGFSASSLSSTASVWTTALLLLSSNCLFGDLAAWGAPPSAQPISVGSSRSTIDVAGTPLDVFTFKPASYQGERMILVMHGVNRNADEYCDHAKGMGDRFGALIVAPKFDEERFPSRKYQRGGILTRDGQAVPSDEWTYQFIPRLAAAARGLEERPTMPYWIIGHSAGGQFVVRMSACIDTGAEQLVAANPGSQLFPTRDMPFGYGFGGLPEELSSDEALKRYLAAPLTLYLGTADDQPDRYFDHSEPAMKQGDGRWQRGHAAFKLAQKVAADHGWPCNWQLVEADGVPHDHQRMFDHPQCAQALFGPRVKQPVIIESKPKQSPFERNETHALP